MSYIEVTLGGQLVLSTVGIPVDIIEDKDHQHRPKPRGPPTTSFKSATRRLRTIRTALNQRCEKTIGSMKRLAAGLRQKSTRATGLPATLKVAAGVAPVATAFCDVVEDENIFADFTTSEYHGVKYEDDANTGFASLLEVVSYAFRLDTIKEEKALDSESQESWSWTRDVYKYGDLLREEVPSKVILKAEAFVPDLNNEATTIPAIRRVEYDDGFNTGFASLLAVVSYAFGLDKMRETSASESQESLSLTSDVFIYDDLLREEMLSRGISAAEEFVSELDDEPTAIPADLACSPMWRDPAESLLAWYRQVHAVTIIESMTPHMTPHIIIQEAPPQAPQESYMADIQDRAYGQCLTVPYQWVQYANYAPYRYETAAYTNVTMDTDKAGDDMLRSEDDDDSGYGSEHSIAFHACDGMREYFPLSVIVSPCPAHNPYHIDEDDDDLPDLNDWL